MTETIVIVHNGIQCEKVHIFVSEFEPCYLSSIQLHGTFILKKVESINMSNFTIYNIYV